MLPKMLSLAQTPNLVVASVSSSTFSFVSGVIAASSRTNSASDRLRPQCFTVVGCIASSKRRSCLLQFYDKRFRVDGMKAPGSANFMDLCVPAYYCCAGGDSYSTTVNTSCMHILLDKHARDPSANTCAMQLKKVQQLKARVHAVLPCRRPETRAWAEGLIRERH